MKSPTAVPAPSAPLVTTGDGSLRGEFQDGLEVWRGIPFAAPPVGPLRWRAPQPAEPWASVLDATAFKSDCVQLPIGWPAYDMTTTTSEDCLYLNVWRPSGTSHDLPVLVWIYGGGWVIGGTSAPVYSGASLARRGVIVVSLNYRVGRFGWFAHPQLTRESAGGGLLYNYGTLDQIAALRWVKRNIAAFGGDPDNITVMGESAGGVSIHVLATSPLVEDGLFHKGIVMSGANGGDLGSGELADAEGLGLNFASRKGIRRDDPDALARLRALPASEIADGLTFGVPPHDPPTFNGGGPVEDGKIVAKVGRAYASGAFRRVPMIVGATADDLGGRIGFMIAGARRFSALLAGKGIPTYQYRFSYVAPSSPIKSAFHASDVPFFLGTQAAQYGEKTAPADDAMADAIASYLIRFVRTDPDDPSMGDWPRFGPDDGKIMNFSASGTADVIDDPWASEIDGAPPPSYPGLSSGGSLPGAPPTGDPASRGAR